MGVAAFQRRSIMDQSKCPISENLPLGRLVAAALGELERLEYTRRSRDRYRAIWRHLIEFCRQNKLGDEFSGDLAARFVEEYRMGDEEVDKPGEGWRRHIVFGVNALADFAQHGRIERAVIDMEKIDFSFGHRLFERAPENSRSFWIF